MRTAEAGGRKAERGRRPEDRGRAGRILPVLCLSSAICLLSSAASAQDDLVRIVEEKRIELKAREEALKREEERLNILKKEVEQKIADYTRLLDRVEAALGKVEQVKGGRIENVVKAYEAMPAEDAAARLSVLDHDTLLVIITRMKSKKAGAVMALMEPAKAASLTRSMAAFSVKDGKSRN